LGIGRFLGVARGEGGAEMQYQAMPLSCESPWGEIDFINGRD